MAPAHCPPSTDLESLFLGEGAADEVQALEEHLLQCDACLETLKTLLGTRDTLAELLRGQLPADPYQDSPAAAALVRSLGSLAETAADPPGPAPADAIGQRTPDLGSQGEPTRDGTVPDAAPGPVLTAALMPPRADDELGRLGKYRVLGVLGHGGMGVVYRAEDPQLRRAVALKAMLPGLAAVAGAAARFLREAQAMAALRHDHVVTIYQVDEDRGVPFLAMELLEGEPLERRLARGAPFSVAEVLRIGGEVAEGLAAAHARGLIHRDIKPANLWLEAPLGRVKILDFGLARAGAHEANLTQRGAILGTPAYMAPEQARGDSVDARADLFSLGVILYRLATGRPPFRGRDTIATLMAVATQTPAVPARLNPALPDALSDLVMRLLEKDPDRRPASAAALAQALQTLEALPGSAGGRRGPARRRRPLRRAAALALTAALAAALLGTGALALVRRAIVPHPEATGNGRPEPFAAWCAAVAALPAEQQATAVGEQLRACNPGFDGVITSRVEGGVVTELQFLTHCVTDLTPVQALPGLRALRCPGTPQRRGLLHDLTPLRGMRLTELEVNFTDVADLTPLQGMRLVTLRCWATSVQDLAPLRGMPLRELDLSDTRIADLTPLRGMDLRRLACNNTAVSDLTPLRDMRPHSLCIGSTRVKDLTPLRDMRLDDLDCSDTPIADLTPLQDMRLSALWCHETRVTDLSPLKGMRLESLFCDVKPARDAVFLRSIKTLVTINEKPATDFWKELDAAAP